MLSAAISGIDPIQRGSLIGVDAMWDVLMLLATVVFFAVAIAYTNACERLR